jgi:hypothetical protein
VKQRLLVGLMFCLFLVKLFVGMKMLNTKNKNMNNQKKIENLEKRLEKVELLNYRDIREVIA